MRIIAFRTIREFYEKPEYADSEISLRSWYHDAKTAKWKSSNELKQQYKNASVVGEGRVVFNIKGNSYRLVVAIDYEFQVIFMEVNEYIHAVNSLVSWWLAELDERGDLEELYGDEFVRQLQILCPIGLSFNTWEYLRLKKFLSIAWEGRRKQRSTKNWRTRQWSCFTPEVLKVSGRHPRNF